MKHRQQSGSLLVSAILITSVFLFIALAMSTYMLTRFQLAQRGVATTSALSAARSGLDAVVQNVNSDEYYYKFCSCLGVETTVAAGGLGTNKVTYTIQNVAHTTSSMRQSYGMVVTVVGKVYRGTSSTVISQKAIRGVLSAVNEDGTNNEKWQYAIQGGFGNSGGRTVTVEGQADVRAFKIRTGGSIRVANAGNTNPSIVATDVWASDVACASGSTYPVFCGNAVLIPVTETIAGANLFTITNLHAPAGGTPTSGVVVTNTYRDAVSPDDAYNRTAYDLPDLGRQQIKNHVVNTITGDQLCNGSTITLGTKPGETTKIVGNVNLYSGCTATLRGDLWVTGWFIVQSNSTLKTGDTDSDGKIIHSAPIVMVDGFEAGTARSILVRGNGTLVTSNAYGVGMILGSYYCNYGSCPDGEPSDTELLDTQDNAYVEIESQAAANHTDSFDIAYYSRWGLTYGTSGTNTIEGAMVGQSVRLIGLTKLYFDDILDLNLGGRQGKVFQLKSYDEIALPTANEKTTTDGDGTCAGTSTNCSSGNVGAGTSVATGSDGLPVVAYFDNTTNDVKVLKCGVPNCSSGNTISTIATDPDANDTFGGSLDIAIGTDGYPVVSYYGTGSLLNLYVTKCSNLSCSSTTADPAGANYGLDQVDATGDVGAYNSIAIGVDGYPVVAYRDVTNSNLKVMKCVTVDCSSGNTFSTTVDTATTDGYFSSIAIGVDGFPVISHFGNPGGDLRVVKCANKACSGTSTMTTVNTTGLTGYYSSIAIGADGFPIVATFDGTGGDLWVIACPDAACVQGTKVTTRLDQAGAGAGYSSLTIGNGGLPVISYYAGSAGLKVVQCTDVDCSGGNITTVDSTSSTGQYSIIAIGADGLPVVSYYDSANTNLRVTRCASFSCQ